MAILANSTRTSTVQPLLRAAGPCRVLTDAEVIALTADAVQTLNVLTAETRDMLNAIEPEIVPHGGAPLPSLQTAFSRRRAIFGAVALAAAPVAALPALAAPVAADPLFDLLRRSNALIAYAHDTSADSARADEAMDQADDLMHEAFDLRATTPAGALASLQWARDEFARYYVTEKMDDDPDWMDRLTLNMLDSALGILRPMVEGVHHA